MTSSPAPARGQWLARIVVAGVLVLVIVASVARWPGGRFRLGDARRRTVVLAILPFDTGADSSLGGVRWDLVTALSARLDDSVAGIRVVTGTRDPHPTPMPVLPESAAVALGAGDVLAGAIRADSAGTHVFVQLIQARGSRRLLVRRFTISALPGERIRMLADSIGMAVRRALHRP